MPFFDSGDPTGGLDPTDPRVIRRLGMLGLGPGMPMQPPSVAPMPMPIDATPPSQALQRIYAAQPPSLTSQGLISAMKGPSDWSDAPRPTQDMMRQYGITDLTPPPRPVVNPAHGFWGKLGQHLLGAAEGAGSQRGLLPMLVGGIAGGVRPQLGANAWYNNVTTPRWQQQAGAQQELANRRLGQIAQVGAMTGVDPTTGQPTYAAQQADVAQDARQAALDQKAAHDKEMADERRQHQQELMKKDLDMLEFKRSSFEDQMNRADLDRTSREKIAQMHDDTKRQIDELNRQIREMGGSTVTRDTFESVDPARDPANAAKVQQIYNEEGSKANQEHWKPQILNPVTGKMEPNPTYNPNYDAKGDPDVQRRIDKRIAAEIGKPTEKKTGTITERTKGGGQLGPQATAGKRPFPAAHLGAYMAQMGFKTREEALAQLAKDGFTLDEGK